jgi:hypothetical protein
MPLPYYDLRGRIVTNVTQARPPVVTTSVNHGYTSGEAIRMVIPKPFGMTQLTNRIFVIEVLSPVTFSLYVTLVPEEVPMDTTKFDPFVLATGLQPQVASVTPVGASPILPPEPGNIRFFITTLDDQTQNTLVQSGGTI